MCYTATIMVLVYRIFDHFYTKYFPDIGVVFLVLTLFISSEEGANPHPSFKLLYLDEGLLMSPRSRLRLGMIAGVLLVLLAIPWTRRTIASEAFLKPADQRTCSRPRTESSRRSSSMKETTERGQALFRSRARLSRRRPGALSEQERFTEIERQPVVGRRGHDLSIRQQGIRRADRVGGREIS
jgi:hypothetical protein